MGHRVRLADLSGRSEKGLGVKATRGVFWVGGGQFMRQAIQVVTSVVLARLLLPQDFGLLGMAVVFVGLSQLLADFGIGAAIVQAQETSDAALSSSFWLNLLVGVILIAAVGLAAPWIADFYGEPRVEILARVLSLTLLMSSVMVVPRAILYKSLDLKGVVKSQVIGSIVGSAAAVSLAWIGWGVWSLILQPVIGSAVTVFLTFLYSGWRPKFIYSWPSVKDLAYFSMPVLGSDLVNYANRNSDSLIIGKVLGSQLLGYYSLAYQIMLYPMTQVSSVVVRILFPTLSKVQEDPDRFSSAYLKSVAAIALVTFPMMTGLFVLAEDFVLAVFGEKWLPMTDVLRILSWVGLLQSINVTAGTIYLSTGKPKFSFYVAALSAPVLIGAFLIGVHWGLVGVSLAYAIACLVVTGANLSWALHVAAIPLSSLFDALVRPFAASLAMMALVWACNEYLYGWPVFQPLARLIVCVLLGVVVYLLMSALVNRRQLREILAIGRAALSRT